MKPTDPTADLVRLLLDIYVGQPDDYVLSVGHWKPPAPDDWPIPTFVARVRLTIGGLKKMLDPSYPYDELMNP